MFVTKSFIIVILGLIAQTALGWEIDCGGNYPRFEGPPPEIKIEKEGGGSVNIMVPYAHESINLYAILLTIIIPNKEGTYQIDVPLDYDIENGTAVTGLSTSGSAKEIYGVRVKYSDHHCGPSLTKEFTLDKPDQSH